MKLMLLPILTALSYFVALSLGSKILVLIPISSKSHKNSFDPLIDELVKRNHEITLVTCFNSTKPIPGVTTVYLADAYKQYNEMSPFAANMSMSPLTMFLKMREMWGQMCHVIFNDPSMVAFLKKSEHYDVILVSAILNECYLPLAHEYGIPIIMISPCALMVNIAWDMNIPNPVSYIPFLMAPYKSEMTLKQRFYNFLLSIFWIAVRELFLVKIADEAVHKYIPNAVSSAHVHKNMSFLLVNSHFSFDDSRPSMPYMAEVGAMHCRPAKNVSEEFENFIKDSGEDGFIVFSMGSVVQGQYLPENLVNAFKVAFSQIKQRVIWKYEKPMEGLSPNVMISQWIPQQDLIGHQKCRLAITHGGLLSLQEVAYHGVPLLGVPFGADRDGNLNRAIDKGFADVVDYQTVTPEIVVEKINKLLGNKQFKENAAEISALMKDRPQPPVETAAYWVEYVIRHKGAKHLRSAAEKLNFFQYFSLDVITLLSIISFTVFAITVFIFKTLISCCFKRFKQNRKQKVN